MIKPEALVLDDTVQASELDALAATAGWKLINRIAYGRDDLAERVWEIAPETYFSETQHHRFGVRFVSGWGADIDAARRALEVAAEAVATHDFREYLDVLLREPMPDDLTAVRAWRRFTATMWPIPAGQPVDPRLEKAVRRYLAHPTRQVRLTTLLVVDNLGNRWEQLIDIVAERKGVEVELADLIDSFVEPRTRDLDQDA